MAPRAHTVTIPSDTRYLREVRAFVAREGAEAGLADEAIHALQLAVDEACANAIEHGYAGRPDGEVEVAARVRRQGTGRPALVVAVRHRGSPYDPERDPPPALAQSLKTHRRGGYGLHLIHRLVDAVAFRQHKGASEVLLTKQIGNGHA